MEINILFDDDIYQIKVNENFTVEDLREKCVQIIFKKKPHKDHELYYFLYGHILLFNKYDKLKDYGVKENRLIKMFSECKLIPGGCIDNLEYESKTPIAKKIGFDMNLIKRDELKINLIHFDLNMTNEENYRYFNNFKVDVVGGFYAIDDINIFIKFLKKISEKEIPFLVVSSGNSAKEIIPICKQYSFIKEVIIFCMNYKYNKHYINDYPGYVKKVTTSIEELYDYLKKFYGNLSLCLDCFPEAHYQFSDNEIRMDNQIKECPIITKEEYSKCYFLVHRAYGYFFENFNSKNHSFGDENYKIIEDLLNEPRFSHYFKNDNDKSILTNIFKELKNSKSSKIFVEKTIRKYTGESIFCYLFNKMMRNIEPGIIYLSYFMGPFLFELNKYVKNRKECAFSKNMILYRIFKCTETEFYFYKLNLNHIMCFPALTSTSSKDINFNPTNLAGEINKKEDDSLTVKLIIKYNHENDNISPGIIIEDKKGYDNRYLSANPFEKEVILFPFTFAKILSINSEIKYGKEIKIVNMELINRKSYIEYSIKSKSYKESKSSCSII